MPRPLLLVPLLLLAGTVAAQVAPIHEKGYILYRGRVAIPGLSRAQVLHRAVGYAQRHLAGENSFAAPWLVDSAAYLVSGAGQQGVPRPLRYELLVRADVGGYRYEVSDLRTEVTATGGQTAPGMGLRQTTRYEPVEGYWDRLPATHSFEPRPSPQLDELDEFVVVLNQEVEAVLAQLRAEMARP